MQRLRSPDRVDRRQAEQRRRVGVPLERERAQRVEDRLPPLGEERPDEPFEERLVAHGHPRGAEPQPHDRRPDLRGRPERAWRQRQHPLHVGAPLNEDREDTVLGRTHRRGQPVGDLALKHERRIDEAAVRAVRREESEQDRRRDVIGQVARHPQRTAGDERAQVEIEEIRANQRRVGGERRRQPIRQIAIDFDRRQLADARGQPQREDSMSGADLEEPIAGGRIDGLDDLVGPDRLEEVLPEALARATYAFSIDSPRQNFSSISSISSSLIPK